jgi:predicted Zn-dependent protease
LPDDASLWAAAAEVAMERGDLPLARARLRSALKRHRRQSLALALLVRLWLRLGQPRRALHAGRVALRTLPPEDETSREVARAHLALGEPREALLLLRRYTLAAPADPEGYELLARALEAEGQTGAARTQRRLAGVAAGGPRP